MVHLVRRFEIGPIACISESSFQIGPEPKFKIEFLSTPSLIRPRGDAMCCSRNAAVVQRHSRHKRVLANKFQNRTLLGVTPVPYSHDIAVIRMHASDFKTPEEHEPYSNRYHPLPL